MSEFVVYSRSHIRDLRYVAVMHELSAPNGFWTESEELLCFLYNGIGPEKWSGRFRRLTTWLLEFFEADALIHDYEYSLPGKSYWKFTLANLRFAYNACKLAFAGHSFRHAVRVSLLGCLLALLCQLFGYAGYLSGEIPGKDENEKTDCDGMFGAYGDSDRLQYSGEECRSIGIGEESDS